MNTQQIRQAFPILNRLVNDSPLVYFDNAATTQKPQAVIDAIGQVYQQYNANAHRGSHTLAYQTTSELEQARSTIQRFINAPSARQVIWTQGTTDSINIVAKGLQGQISNQHEIVLSEMEHHANFVPWLQLAQITGAKLVVIPVNQDGQLVEHWQDYLSHKTALVAISFASNVTGVVNPITDIVACAKGHNALTLVDAAQYVGHHPIDVQALDCDYLCFSGHKMYGPNGIGVLYGKQAALSHLTPSQFGGEMVAKVTRDGFELAELPHRLEAGTSNYPAAIGLAGAVNFLIENNRQEHESRLADMCLWLQSELTKVPGINLLTTVKGRLPIISFTHQTMHPQDLALALDAHGIAVRTGYHCAMPLLQKLCNKEQGVVRLSLAIYNTMQECEYFIDKLGQILCGEQDSTNDSEIIQQQVPPFNEIKQLLLKNKSWDYQYRELLKLGKALPPMDAEHKVTQNLVQGCESKVWLYGSQPQFVIDSDAKIVRGLILILQSIVQSLPASDVSAFDISACFAELGLTRHLSESRNSGLAEIIRRVQQ